MVEGEIVEERLVLGGGTVARRHAAGAVFDFDASHVHRMHQDGGRADRLDPRLLAAAVADGHLRGRPDGTLCRTSISYAEELRPVETAA